jgi:1-pyrroline-5-carboxylate dehydrogenase
MIHGNLKVPVAVNEPVKTYAPGNPERESLKAALKHLSLEKLEISPVIGGKKVHTGKTAPAKSPHQHAHVIAEVHQAGPDDVNAAITNALATKEMWSRVPFHERAAIFLRAAELLASDHRAILNAATMLGQSKTAYQAEIDAACEAIDFLRFNVQFAQELYAQQPQSQPGMWNQTDYRPLDGFVFAVAPFNFTAIALNLCTAPALMGNTVVFKPAQTAIVSAWRIMELLEDAGLPPGVINFVPGPGASMGRQILEHPDLGGVHFTGSTATFNGMWKTVGDRIDSYRQYPRLVGETGGKDFIFVHPSAIDDVEALAVAITRGGYEYQGQKCSACSRVYVPKSVWQELELGLIPMINELKMGDVADFRNFMGAVIDEKSFANTQSYIDLAKRGLGAKILAGGETDKSVGYFVRPTLVQLEDPRHKIMTEEIFAPVVGVFVYPDDKFEETLKECDKASPYALTGSIWARDRRAIATATDLLRHTAGNFYINDKPTGAVVGQQPFGGSRGSGTNDKAGSLLNLVRWTSPRTIKETFVPPTRVGYPFQGAE